MSAEQIKSTQLNDDTIVINPGRLLDNNNAHEMAENISTAQSRGFLFIVVDMTHLEFISSAGVGSILGSVEISRESGGDIILCNVSDNIFHVLEVLDLADYLTIRENQNEAEEFCRALEQN